MLLVNDVNYAHLHYYPDNLKSKPEYKLHYCIIKLVHLRHTSEVDVESRTQPPLSLSDGIKLPSSFKTGKPRPT